MHNKHPLLSQLFLAFLLSLTSTLTFAAIQQNPIAGHWEGAIKLPTGALNISVDFTAAADGKLSATITIPQQGAKDLPLAGVGFTDGEVTFSLPNIPGDPKFRGKLSSDGQKIEGTFSQGGANLPCNLERKADPVAVLGGQPPMDLVPGLSGDFTLKQVQVVSLHFVMDDKGNAGSFELRQPGTVLTAKRKQ